MRRRAAEWAASEQGQPEHARGDEGRDSGYSFERPSHLRASSARSCGHSSSHATSSTCTSWSTTYAIQKHVDARPTFARANCGYSSSHATSSTHDVRHPEARRRPSHLRASSARSCGYSSSRPLSLSSARWRLTSSMRSSHRCASWSTPEEPEVDGGRRSASIYGKHEHAGFTQDAARPYWKG